MPADRLIQRSVMLRLAIPIDEDKINIALLFVALQSANHWGHFSLHPIVLPNEQEGHKLLHTTSQMQRTFSFIANLHFSLPQNSLMKYHKSLCRNHTNLFISIDSAYVIGYNNIKGW